MDGGLSKCTQDPACPVPLEAAASFRAVLVGMDWVLLWKNVRLKQRVVLSVQNVLIFVSVLQCCVAAFSSLFPCLYEILTESASICI